MRPQREIQRAHDLLQGVLRSDAGDPAQEHIMLHAAEVLCWVLEHRNSGFGSYLARIEGKQRAVAQGEA